MEIWKKINGYEGYEVSNMGRIRSLDRIIKVGKNTRKVDGKILKLQLSPRGYLTIDICILNKHKYMRVNRIVAQEFLENKENKEQVNHKNGIKTDNRVENLEWTTSGENNKHAFDTGLNSNDAKRKKVQCSNGMIFNSSYEAGEWINQELFKYKKLTKNIASKIRSSCNGFQKIAYGFSWKHKLD